MMYGNEHGGYMMPANGGGPAGGEANWYGIHLLGPLWGHRDGSASTAEGREEIQQRIERMLDCPSIEKDASGAYRGDYVYNGWLGDIRPYPPTNDTGKSKFHKISNVPQNVLIAMDINEAMTDGTHDRFYDWSHASAGAALLRPVPAGGDNLDRPLRLAGTPHGKQCSPRARANMLFMDGTVRLGEPGLIVDAFVRFTIRGNKNAAFPW